MTQCFNRWCRLNVLLSLYWAFDKPLLQDQCGIVHWDIRYKRKVDNAVDM